MGRRGEGGSRWGGQGGEEEVGVQGEGLCGSQDAKLGLKRVALELERERPREERGADGSKRWGAVEVEAGKERRRLGFRERVYAATETPCWDSSGWRWSRRGRGQAKRGRPTSQRGGARQRWRPGRRGRGWGLERGSMRWSECQAGIQAGGTGVGEGEAKRGEGGPTGRRGRVRQRWRLGRRGGWGLGRGSMQWLGHQARTRASSVGVREEDDETVGEAKRGKGG